MYLKESAIVTKTGKKPALFLSALLVTILLISQVGLTPSKAAPGAADFSVAISSEPATLDAPDASMNTLSDFQVDSQIYDTLVRFGPGSSSPTPGLAQSWATSSDGLTWSFTLRSGVTFHDGTMLDSSAVLFNFQRWWDPTHPQHDGAFPVFNSLFGIKNDPSGPNYIAGLSSPDSTHFVITLNAPAPVLTFLAYPALGIGSPTAIQAGTIDTQPVGSGPFKFNTWVKGVHISLDRYDGYWGSIATASTLTFKVIGDSASQLAALQSNSVQSASGISGDSLTTALADPALQVLWRPSSAMGYLGLNRSKTPLDNLLVRQAIAHAIDKRKLVSLYYLAGTHPSTQYLPPSIWGFDSTISDYTYDPALAKSLLAQAGYPSGITIGLAYRTVFRGYLPQADAIAAAVQADLAAANITTNLERYTDNSLFITKVNAGDFDAFLLGWIEDYPDPYNYFNPLFCGTSQPTGVKDTQLCAKIADGLSLQTDALRLAAYQWASQRVRDTLPVIPLVSVSDPVVMRRTAISGATPAFFTEDYASAFVPSHWTFLPSIAKP